MIGNETLDIMVRALAAMDAGRAVALATVVSTWGSAPRPVGAMLLVKDDGTFHGSVSGGCVEGAVMLAAQDAMAEGKCQVLDFGVTDEDAFAVGLACGGNIKILVDPIGRGNGMPVDMLRQIISALGHRRPVGCITNFGTWNREIISPGVYNTGQSQLDDGQIFTWIGAPSLRLIVVGAVHIAQHLCPIAEQMGFEVSVIDPRAQFATRERFPHTVLSHDWPDAAINAALPDARTAVVTLTHDPKFDLPALQAALASDAFYIGALGSTRTQAKRAQALIDMGVDEPALGRIHGPVGLDIGAATPAEIAVSIAAEMVQNLRRGDLQRGADLP